MPSLIIKLFGPCLYELKCSLSANIGDASFDRTDKPFLNAFLRGKVSYNPWFLNCICVSDESKASNDSLQEVISS